MQIHLNSIKTNIIIMSYSAVCNECGQKFDISQSLHGMSYELNVCCDCKPRKSILKCVCEGCGKIFYDTAHRVSSGRGRFCSRHCKDKWMSSALSGKNNPNYSDRVEIECKVCGNKIYTIPSRPKKSKNMYCSRECYRKARSLFMCGKNAANYQGGKSYEPYCDKFNEEFKNRVRAFFLYKCILCGITQSDNIVNGKSEKLSVHHVNYNKSSCCDLSSPIFATLCRTCHSKTNRKSHTDRRAIEEQLTNIINTNYNGKSYFTKEEFYQK